MTPKFKLYDSTDQKIREVTDIDWSLGIVGTQGGAIEYELDNIELMQSTGLRDKTYEKEIYSDQILLVDGEKGNFKAKVIYECGAFGIVAVKGRIIDYFPDNWNDDFMTLLDLYWNYNNDDNCIDQVEVVGNIYENSELLEEQ